MARHASISPCPSFSSSIFSTSTSRSISSRSSRTTSTTLAGPSPKKQDTSAPSSNTATNPLPLSLPGRKTCVKTNLSFCLPRSLAFFRHLNWEQTPWIPCPNRLPQTHIQYLSTRLQVPCTSVENALFFGSNGHVKLYIVFPHAGRDPALDARFLDIWHGQIVKPAFDRAWWDSGCVVRRGAERGGRGRILPAGGVWTSQDAVPACDIVRRFRLRSQHAVSAPWPESRKHVGEAWEAVTGMLRDYPGMEEFQDPRLLAIYGAEVHLGERMGPAQMCAEVKKEWDGLVDWEFMVEKSLGVVLETTMVEETGMKGGLGIGGGKGKRRNMEEGGWRESGCEGDRESWEEGGYGDGSAHRSKRRKVVERGA